MNRDLEAPLVNKSVPSKGWSGKVLCSLPVRMLLYSIFMLLFYPILLLFSVLRACYKRAKWGKVSDILKYGGRMWPGDVPYEPADKGGVFYAAQMVFSKPFVEAKLTPIFMKMVEETGISAEKAVLVWDPAKPSKSFHKSGPLDADHYVTPGSNVNKEPDTTLKDTIGKAVIALRIFNGEPGEPTVVHLYLPLNTWDGSSCFNFMKELVNRNCGGVPTDFFQATKVTLKPESKEKLDKVTSFPLFLCRQPYCLFVNLSALIWQLVSCSPCFGGGGFAPELAYFNFDEEDSARLARGAKKLGMKPFAAFTYAGVKAYREVLGENPCRIVQQSSLFTRHYVPKQERDAVGDWLIGPLQKIGNREYGFKESQQMYDKLYDDLANLTPTAVRAMEAKAWGLLGGGASLFEFLPSYNDDTMLLNSIFFNNYGCRTVHKDSGFYSWNWGAPYRLGFNTINVNGKTCTVMASSVLGLPKLQEVRDNIVKTLQEIMDDGNMTTREKKVETCSLS